MENNQPSANQKCFWGLAGQIVSAIAPHTEAHPMALLSQLLVSYGNIVGRGPYFKTEADQQRCNLFVLNVGNSSKGRKGTSWGQVRNLLTGVDSEWLSKNVVAGFGSGESLIWKLRDGSDVENDSWSIPDKKLLIMESEFGGLLKVVNKENNTTSAVLRNAWDGSTLRNITKGSTLQASDHHVSVIGHITKTELVQLLREREVMNGLANRFLCFSVSRTQFKPFGGTPPIEDIQIMASELNAAVVEAKTKGEIKRSKAADDLWEAIYPELSDGLPGIVGSLSSRSEAQVMRLALVLSLINKQPMISIEALQCALSIHEYCMASLKYIFGDKLGIALPDRLYEYICSHDHGITRTNVRDYLQRNYPKDSVDDAIKILCDARMIEIITVSSNGGRPTEVLRKQEKSNKECFTVGSYAKNDISPLLSYKSLESGHE
ncbi:DUF3987 domain-containing protein [Bdellovibrio sp. HCB290]|uniref:DUF3987 domain-containing protein n=1 Tax=Bdellovibrio sp. HCB290 TaxID=3394356 RepID=UPI0039B41254